eukprot:COSAG04_NODE_27351_length_284_cov_0.751351_1_plen_31_part_01
MSTTPPTEAARRRSVTVSAPLPSLHPALLSP